MKDRNRPFQAYHEHRLRQPDRATPHNLQELESLETTTRFQGHDPESYQAHIERVQGPEAVEAFSHVLRVAEAIKEAGGRALLVGGAVRDEFIGRPSKDFDLEVYGIEPEQLAQIMKELGSSKDVGKKFAITKLKLDGGFELDVSIPMRDSVSKEVDPHMSIEDAGRRRDFTFNAMSKDPLTGEIFDPFEGARHLAERRLVITDRERFKDDPLRIIRGAQFMARFGLSVDPETLQFMRDLAPRLKFEAKERFLPEWNKLLCKADRPSLGLMALNDMGVIDALYPELAALRGVPHEFEWHPEGDVWVHTLMVVDKAVEVARRRGLEPGSIRHRRLMYGGLTHDFGKPEKTEFIEGRWRSRGHEPAGVEPTLAFLGRIGFSKDEADAIAKLVATHIWPGERYREWQKTGKVSKRAFNRQAERIAPATIVDLTYLMEADADGRGPWIHPDSDTQLLLPFPDKAGEWTREQARAFGVETEPAPDIIKGRDLKRFGWKGGIIFGQIIRAANRLRDEGAERESVLFMIEDAGGPEAALERLEQELTKYEQDS